MKCTYDDGTYVKYSGPLQIVKGQEVNVFLKEERIPDGVKSDLDKALFHNSCGELRRAADTVTAAFGPRACIHE
jgi:hypothetical protein